MKEFCVPDEKLKAASHAYGIGYTCSQAVFCAYAEDMGIDRQTACRMMEGFGCGVCGTENLCGALAAACAIISYHCCDGTPSCEKKRTANYEKIQKAVALFKREYGATTCHEVLHGESPKPFQCGMKVKDAVLIISQVLREVDSNA